MSQMRTFFEMLIYYFYSVTKKNETLLFAGK